MMKNRAGDQAITAETGEKKRADGVRVRGGKYLYRNLYVSHILGYLAFKRARLR